MLLEIYLEALAVMEDRQNSSTVYCGWGSFIDQLIDEYLEQGGSYRLVRKALNKAYYKTLSA